MATPMLATLPQRVNRIGWETRLHDDDPSEPTRQLRDKLLRMAHSQNHAVGQ